MLRGNLFETTGRGDPSSEIGDVDTIWLDEESGHYSAADDAAVCPAKWCAAELPEQAFTGGRRLSLRVLRGHPSKRPVESPRGRYGVAWSLVPWPGRWPWARWICRRKRKIFQEMEPPPGMEKRGWTARAARSGTGSSTSTRSRSLMWFSEGGAPGSTYGQAELWVERPPSTAGGITYSSAQGTLLKTATRILPTAELCQIRCCGPRWRVAVTAARAGRWRPGVGYWEQLFWPDGRPKRLGLCRSKEPGPENLSPGSHGVYGDMGEAGVMCPNLIPRE